ncbi:MAG: phosphotransacetylase [Endomicrobium sp.]|jgi:phosphate acetyltransferase|nr:phosphotransacetylase [Endomicrobium sp.]
MDIKKYVLNLSKKSKKKVILPESFDERVIRAAHMLTEDGIASVILPTHNIKILKKNGYKIGINLDKIEIIEIDINLLDKDKVEKFIDARRKKNISRQDSIDLLEKNLYFSMMYLKSGKCNACVCGAVYDTTDVLRAGFHVIGPAEGIDTVSSYFLMIPPKNHTVIKEPIFFADCAVNPEPNSIELRDIAILSVKNFKKLFPNRFANVSMLSFSTKGSANNKVLSKIIEATEFLKNFFAREDDINVDGEFQFDAAIIPSVGKRKAPNSSISGKSNIMIFPDLNSGNIGYKIAERLGGFQALGPVLQGLDLPVSDLSRGSSSDDIYLISSILLL